MIGPIFEKMAEEFPDAVFVKVDVDQADDIAGQCGIRAMPTFQFYKGGQMVEEFSGASEQKLRATVMKHL
jgi:thioredoxin-like negative regulator of GroEL